MPSDSTGRPADSVRLFRIGAGAGFSGDRIDPARDLAERGALDMLVFECLAERTIALAQLRRAADPAAGFDPLLAERMRAVLPACVRNGTRVVTNMGAANPRAAGRVVCEVARELGLAGLRVAVVTGDDVIDALLDRPVPLIEPVPMPMAATAEATSQLARSSADLEPWLVSANAYIGADALLPALQTGAEVVIAGRVADPALFLAPLMQHFGWAADDWPLLGRGICVGHLLECAAQVSGGYLADPGRLDVPNLADVGFPFAEVSADGDCLVSKLSGTGGRVDRLSCTTQLLYEVEDPARYLQPDVTADFSSVTLQEDGLDRVWVRGASGHARPGSLKASLGYRDGFVGEGQISYAGPGARARGELARRVLVERLPKMGLAGREHRADLIGVDAMHGGASHAAAVLAGPAAEPWEVRVRFAVRCASRAEAERVTHEVDAMYLNGPASGGGVVTQVREVLAVASCLVPREAVQTRVEIMEAAR
jgi:hypothetical protein